MQLVYHRKIGTRLGFGFAAVAGLTILLGVTALTEMKSLTNLTRDLYDHPLVVSNAIRDIHGNILAMQRSMRDIILEQTDTRRQEAISQVDQEEQEALRAFDTVYGRFLGDKADVDAARKAFMDWRPIRREENDLIQSGRKDQAAQIAQSKGVEQVLRINEHLQVVGDFAKQKATFLLDSAQKSERLHLWFMSGLILLISAASILGGLLIARSITRPLRYVMQQIGGVAGGNLDHKINLNSDDEIGQLAQTFDEMTASLKKVTASRNELDAANQQLEAAIQQLQSHQHQLNAVNQKLHASEQHRESIISAVPGIVFCLQMDAGGDFSIPYMSRQAESIIGHPLDILIQADCFFDIIHSEDIEEFYLSIRESARTLDPWTFECRVFDINGRLKWLKGVSTPQRLADQSTAWNGIIVDITDHKQDEARLLENEERYRIVADNTYDWEFWIDPDGQYVYISPSCHRIAGFTVEEFKTDPDLLKAIIHPDDRQVYQAHLMDVRTRYSVGSIEFRIINKDQQIRWIEHLCQPIFDKYGKWLGTRGSNRDITDRKQAEQILRQGDEQFSSLFENAPDAIFIQSQGRFVCLNSAMIRLLGASSAEELLGREFMERIAPQYHEAIHQRIRLQQETGDPALPMEQEYLRLDGSRILVETVAAAVRFQGSDAHMVFVRDISERKNSETSQLLHTMVTGN